MSEPSADPTFDDLEDDTDDEPGGIGNSPLLLSLMPFALLGLLYIAFPAYGVGAFEARISIGDIRSIPFGLVVVLLALIWGAIGVYLVSESDSFGKAIAVLAAFTLPASFGVVMAPWFNP